MKFNDKNLLLYAVTDKRWSNDTKDFYKQIEDALEGGVTLIQLREKNLSEDEFIKEAMEVKKLTSKYGVPLIINDNINVAIESDADGVHVGQDDLDSKKVRELLGDDKIIGVSARTLEQAKEAELSGADYLGVGAVFSTDTKDDAKVIDRKDLIEICNTVNIPIVAIGGINKDNMTKLKDTGVSGVALVSAIFASDNVLKECRELKRISTDIFVKY